MNELEKNLRRIKQNENINELLICIGELHCAGCNIDIALNDTIKMFSLNQNVLLTCNNAGRDERQPGRGKRFQKHRHSLSCSISSDCNARTITNAWIMVDIFVAVDTGCCKTFVEVFKARFGV